MHNVTTRHWRIRLTKGALIGLPSETAAEGGWLRYWGLIEQVILKRRWGQSDKLEPAIGFQQHSLAITARSSSTAKGLARTASTGKGEPTIFS
jgi:hypothetical protein